MRRVALTVLIAGLVAGCSSSHSNPGPDPASQVIIVPSSGSAPTPDTSDVSLPPSSPPPASTAPITSAAPSAATSPSARSTASPIVERSTCIKIGIRVLPGGASMGQEIAALQFTNTGSKPCKLVGYPQVSLLRSGQQIGKESQPLRATTSERTLAPGEVAESLLHDYVGNCQAPLSESIRVIAPGSDISQTRPMQLRACVVRVDRLGAPD